MKEYYQNENGKLYCCDNLEYLRQTEENSFDMTVTSPPYDNLRNYLGYSWNFEELAKELYRTTKQGGIVVWVVGDATINGSETGSSFRQALYFMECGFNLHDTMIWEKSTIPQNGNRYEPEFEYMFVLSKQTPKTFNPIKVRKLYKDNRLIKNGQRNKDGTFDTLKVGKTLHKTKGNIWKVNTGGGIATKDKCAYSHPAIFPEKLAYDHIISWSNENDLVFDPFMGSGTTAKMAERANRKWVGCEISKEYCEITKNRLETERTQLKMSFEEEL